MVIVGGSVLNDGYQRFEQFILLEKNNELENAKQHPEKYDSMLQINLGHFKNSTEFKNYLQENDRFVDRSEAICIGWIFAFLAEISLLFVQLFNWFFIKKIRI